MINLKDEYLVYSSFKLLIMYKYIYYNKSITLINNLKKKIIISKSNFHPKEKICIN